MAKEGRVGLGFWDRVILFAAWVVTCGLVYVLGFYVGQGTQERRLGLEDRVVRLPVTAKPPPEGQRPKADSDLTFYDTLGSGDRNAAPSPDVPPAAPRVAPPGPPKAVPAAQPPPPAPRPGAASALPAPVRPAIAKATPVAAAPPAAVATAPSPGSVVATAPSPGAQSVPAALPSAAARPALATVPAAPPAVPREAPVAGAALPLPRSESPPIPAGRGWTVQANPTRSRDEADALYRQLRGRGYDATIVRVLRDGDTWFRVQVGRFATSERATETMQRLREHEGVSHVFVASE